VSYERVLCGIDPSEESFTAARQAARLVAPDGTLVLVAVVELDMAVHAGWATGDILDQLRSDSADALERARTEVASVPNVETRLLQGPVLACFREEIEQEKPTLVVVGTHGHRRRTGILLGTVTTTMLHEAPCSVLVARAGASTGAFPSTIAVGIDGSPEADAAAAVADTLAARFGAVVRRISASGGKGGEIAPGAADVEIAPGKPVDVLVKASSEADLLVIGSRGLHGLKALGSVSERVAHEAACSVLVVRESP
jgi:nucleotide-binding universal stress UspA family protein